MSEEGEQSLTGCDGELSAAAGHRTNNHFIKCKKCKGQIKSRIEIEELAFIQVNLIKSYYNLTLDSARASFKWALSAALVGLLVLIASMLFVILYRAPHWAILGFFSGALVEFISAIFLDLYVKSSSSLASFLTKLDSTQRYLVANQLCDELPGLEKHKTRSAVIRAIAGIGSDQSD